MSIEPEVDNTLTVIMEECAEIIKVVSKIKRFGFENYHPKNDDVPNNILLMEEYGDLIGAFDLLKVQVPEYFNESIIEKSRLQKPRKVLHYYDTTR